VNYFPSLHKILLAVQFFAALIGLIYYFKLKQSYWKWFTVYLLFIFVQEFIWTLDLFSLGLTSHYRNYYYTFIGIPFQYIFLYWLYAYKSLSQKKLFYICLILYVFTYALIELYLKKINLAYSINLTTGTILLSFLVVLEFLKQIKNDNILKFKENKMFYINIGVILFYIGTYPFFAFNDILIEDRYIGIWNTYYLYFLISNYLMYFLFAASFIWGKHQSK
jgi:hypothetical protein